MAPSRLPKRGREEEEDDEEEDDEEEAKRRAEQEGCAQDSRARDDSEAPLLPAGGRQRVGEHEEGYLWLAVDEGVGLRRDVCASLLFN